MSASIGYISLITAMLLGIASMGLGFLGRPSHDKLKLQQWASYLIIGLISIAIILLVNSFLSDDFSVKYVAEHSNRALPFFYKLTAFWGALDGSLLLWVWILCAFTGLVTYIHRNDHPELMPTVLAVLAGIAVFFMSVMVFVANPFERWAMVVADGRGMNPILQNPGMVFHPPTLYTGYVGFAVPFAFALATLVRGKFDNEWLAGTRRWTIVAWYFLSMGILMGAWWSYVTLGWGGYWAWDPVENASFMPWLTGTAYLHSVMIQEKRGMFKLWNIILVILTFNLAIFGTFLTRSGLLSSVHAFTASPLLGTYFLAFLALVSIISLYLILGNGHKLKSPAQLDSLICRESSFLYNNVLFVVAAFSVFLGTMFPIFAEAITGKQISVGMPYFNQVMIPIGLCILLLMGIGPMIAWRKASAESLKRNFTKPIIIAIIVALIAAIFGIREFYPLITIGLASFVVAIILIDYYKATRAVKRSTKKPIYQALPLAVQRNQRRYGGLTVHIGMVIIFIAIAGANFNLERETTMQPGESINIGKYTLTYQDFEAGPHANGIDVSAIIDVKKTGKHITQLKPTKRYFLNQKETASIVGLRYSLVEDIYLVLMGYVEDGKVITLRAQIMPLVTWIWIGGLVMTLGMLIAVFPIRKSQHV